MPPRDAMHALVKQALIKDGWDITHDPYIISYGERFLFVDLGAMKEITADEGAGQIIGAQRGDRHIVIEIKELRGRSVMAGLEQAIGQYVLYRLLLNRVAPERELYLAVTDVVYDEIFMEPIGVLIVNDLPRQLLVIDIERTQVNNGYHLNLL